MRCYKSYGQDLITKTWAFEEGKDYMVIPVQDMDGSVCFYQVLDFLGSPWLINEDNYREMFNPPTIASLCDCGGDKTSGHHAHWCKKELDKCILNP